MRTSLSCIPRARTSRMSKMVACWACWFRFTGGRRSMPFEIAFGLMKDHRSTVEFRRTHVARGHTSKREQTSPGWLDLNIEFLGEMSVLAPSMSSSLKCTARDMRTRRVDACDWIPTCEPELFKFLLIRHRTVRDSVHHWS